MHQITCPGCGWRVDPELQDATRRRGLVVCPQCRISIAIAGFSADAAPEPPDIPPATTDDFKRTLEIHDLRPEVRPAVTPGRLGKEPYLDDSIRASLRFAQKGRVSRIVPMKVPRFVIGREDCDLVVRDPEVSRRHAVIEAYGRDFVLVDLGSTNGTHVNGALVDSCRLQNGDCIRVGELEAVFRIASRDDEHEDGATGTAPAQRDEGR